MEEFSMSRSFIADPYNAWKEGALPPVPPEVPEVRVQILNAGICPADRNKMLRGARSAMLDVPAMFALIRHPEKGILLYDTGYATHFYDATKRWPFAVMRKITPVTVLREENAYEQLLLDGIESDQVKTILLSHCHADHAGGLKDFPEATLVVEASEWSHANRTTPLKALLKGNLMDLYTGVDPDRVETIDLRGRGVPYGVFEHTLDLFGDGSLILVLLDGHSPGNMGLIVNRPAVGQGPEQDAEQTPEYDRLFMIADAAWLPENYLEARPPGRATNLILHDPDRLMDNLLRIRAVAVRHPEVMIIPAHSIKAWQKIQTLPFRWPYPTRKGKAGWI